MAEIRAHTDTDDGAPATQRGRGRRVRRPSATQLTWPMSQTLGDLVHERVEGTIDLYLVLSYVALWGSFSEMTGRPPSSNRELALTWNRKPRTVDRWRDRFENAFPELESPAPLWATAREQVRSKDPDVITHQLGAVDLT